jgi:hypothetical protein
VAGGPKRRGHCMRITWTLNRLGRAGWRWQGKDGQFPKQNATSTICSLRDSGENLGEQAWGSGARRGPWRGRQHYLQMSSGLSGSWSQDTWARYGMACYDAQHALSHAWKALFRARRHGRSWALMLAWLQWISGQAVRYAGRGGSRAAPACSP